MLDWLDKRSELVKDLGKVLVKVGALRFGTFSLSSGKLSSYYIDLRVLPSLPGAFRTVIQTYLEIIKEEISKEKFDIVVGIPTAGLTYATAIAYELKKPLVYVRKESKEHGLEKRVEGLLNPGSRGLVVDDLITTGRSILEASQAVRVDGGEVNDALVLIDRLEGGAENLSSEGVKLHSLVGVLELAEFLKEMAIIDNEHFKAIKSQLEKKKT